jgi:hypothetical protein
LLLNTVHFDEQGVDRVVARREILNALQRQKNSLLIAFIRFLTTVRNDRANKKALIFRCRELSARGLQEVSFQLT